MPESRSLTLIAPQLVRAVARASALADARWPQLARLAGRGSMTRIESAGSGLDAWQVGLLEAVGLGEAPERYPSAALTRSGDLNARASGFWMHAMPMHLAAGLDRLTAVVLEGDARVQPAERAQLQSVIAPHLRAAGFELLSTSVGEWLVHSERAREIRTAAPEALAKHALEESMPAGGDAAELRRLMTELQMLLHEHPVNMQRVRRALPEINAIWFHGAGALGESPQRELPQAFGDDLYLRGLYKVSGSEVAPRPADAQQLLAKLSSRAVALIAVEDFDALETVWLVPLARAVMAGSLAQLNLVLGCWRIAVGRAALLRFWRRERAPAQWGAW